MDEDVLDSGENAIFDGEPKVENACVAEQHADVWLENLSPIPFREIQRQALAKLLGATHPHPNNVGAETFSTSTFKNFI